MPVATLLFLLAVLRITAWLSALIASVVTFLLAFLVWGAPFDMTARAYANGAATGVLAVDWMWAALLVGVFYILLIPIIGWIGVALSGSNTSTNTLFGQFQVTVGSLLGFPPLLAPASIPSDRNSNTVAQSPMERLRLYSSLWAAYGVGPILGGFRRERWGLAILLLPIAGLGLVAVRDVAHPTELAAPDS